MTGFRRSLAAFLLLPVLLGLAILLRPGRAAAAEGASAWSQTAHGRLRLVSAVTGSLGVATVPLGLQLELAPGWKTYWRSPGDAGIPVTVDWSASTNLAALDIAWPAPQRFTLFGLDSFGYEDEVVLPLTARPVDAGKPLGLRLKVNYLLCEKICIPYTADLALDLPATAPGPSDFTQLIDRFRAQVPGDGASHGLKLLSVTADGSEARPELVVEIESALPLRHPDLIVEGPDGLYFPAPRITIEGAGSRARLAIEVKRDAAAPILAGTPLVLTVVDGRMALEARVAPAAAVGGSALIAALLAALLGGLILNLMPCVLPVLSLKILAFVGHGDTPRARVRISFLASSAGVISSFLLLAALVAGLKAAGLAVGWGFQFQAPLFLVAMALLVTFFAGNLWGWFEVPMPGFIDAWAGAAGRRKGLVGDFVTGALATLLATPCTAPFLGTALGFALAGGTREILAVFLALGLGLAGPYLLVAAWPALAAHLPRPGRWMLWLKRFLGLALLATAAWLLHVLVSQIGLRASLASAAGLALVLLLLAIPGLRPMARRGGLVAAAMLVLLAPSLLAQSPGAPAAPGGIWQAFDEPALQRLVGQGRVVLVDVTASWCINCQINKALVLDRGWAADALASGRLVGLKADWTNPNPAICGYLASFGRYGIPFNAVYGPRAPQGLPLPAVLSEAALKAAVAQASGEGGSASGGS
jgi:suppressor for copper-sensitivity B